MTRMRAARETVGKPSGYVLRVIVTYCSDEKRPLKIEDKAGKETDSEDQSGRLFVKVTCCRERLILYVFDVSGGDICQTAKTVNLR